MINKLNKRTIILALVLVLFIILIVVNNIEKNNQNVEQTKQTDFEEYLDDGIEFSKLFKEKKYLENILISNIVLNNNNIEYTLKNNSNSSVYISNQITIKVGEDNYHFSDTLEGKIELKPLEEKVITLDCTINELSKTLGYRIDIMQISILKPIYIKYDDSRLLGIAKGGH